ncbi:MAG: hypothetical protein ABSD49_14410 [Candidatus Bathyarchaeia archaeon]
MQYIKEFQVSFNLTTNKGTASKVFNLTAPHYGNTTDGRERLLLDLQQLTNRIMNEGIMKALPTNQSKPAISTETRAAQ